MRDETKIQINCKDDLEYLLNRIESNDYFAKQFVFGSEEYFIAVLNYLKISIDQYRDKYQYYDRNRKIHVASSEEGYVWISTYGLVTKGHTTDNMYLNAYSNQYTVLTLIFREAIDLSQDENILDVDGYIFDYISKLTPALFGNLIFFIEIFFKSYLSISGGLVPKTHELKKLYDLVLDNMFEKGHNDTRFHAQIISELYNVVKYVVSIPGQFKEQYIKYDSNTEDWTIIDFNYESLSHIKNVVDLSNDFIFDYYYDKEESLYLNSGLLDRLISKSNNEIEKKNVIEKYKYLVEKNMNVY